MKRLVNQKKPLLVKEEEAGNRARVISPSDRYSVMNRGQERSERDSREKQLFVVERVVLPRVTFLSKNVSRRA